MNIEHDIFSKSDPNYTAQYGWQRNFGEETFSFGYINSYKSTADLLVDQCIPDLYIFPIMFSYRQYLELVLKNVCYKNMQSNEYKEFVKNASHNLRKIWKNAKLFLEKYILIEYLNVIEEIVKIFDCIDTNSFTFRYEFDKRLNRSINKEFMEINTLKLKKWMDKVDLYLRFTYDSI